VTIEEKARLYDAMVCLMKHAEAQPPRVAEGEGSLFERIVAVCCGLTGADSVAIFGPGRNPSEVNTRKLIYHILRYRAGWTFERIGERFNRDHTTVMWSVRRFNDHELLKAAEATLGFGGGECRTES